MTALQDFTKGLRGDLDMTPSQLDDFDEASGHPYECICLKCKEWWKLVGSEDDDDDGYIYNHEEPL